jgi:hypothetical protein
VGCAGVFKLLMRRLCVAGACRGGLYKVNHGAFTGKMALERETAKPVISYGQQVIGSAPEFPALDIVFGAKVL